MTDSNTTARSRTSFAEEVTGHLRKQFNVAENAVIETFADTPAMGNVQDTSGPIRNQLACILNILDETDRRAGALGAALRPVSEEGEPEFDPYGYADGSPQVLHDLERIAHRLITINVVLEHMRASLTI